MTLQEFLNKYPYENQEQQELLKEYYYLISDMIDQNNWTWEEFSSQFEEDRTPQEKKEFMKNLFSTDVSWSRLIYLLEGLTDFRLADSLKLSNLDRSE